MAATILLGDPLTLQQGATYRGFVGGSEDRFWVGKSAIRSGLEEQGFASVGVSWDPLPGWPADQIVAEPSTGWRAYVQGVWSRPSASVAKPARILRAWKHADAPAGAYVAPPAAPPAPPVPPMVWISLGLTLLRWLS